MLGCSRLFTCVIVCCRVSSCVLFARVVVVAVRVVVVVSFGVAIVVVRGVVVVVDGLLCVLS